MDVELELLMVIYGISVLLNCDAWAPMNFRYGLRGFKLCCNSPSMTCFSWSFKPSIVGDCGGIMVKMFIKTSTSRKTFCIL